MIGFRKIILGIIFLTYSALLSYAGIRNGTDLLSIAGVISSMAIGVGVVVWGNVQSNRKNGAGNDAE